MLAHERSSMHASTSSRCDGGWQAGRPRVPARQSSRPSCRASAAVVEQAAGKVQLGEGVRADFPILDQRIGEKQLIYFDNAATSQKPRQVAAAMDDYYSRYNSNVHRGVHHLSALATAAYEEARGKLAAFIGAGSDREVVWTKNASEAINLVAYAWGAANLKPGDEVLLTVAEHHSNLVPWQLIARATGARLRHVPLTRDGQELDMQAFHELLGERTKMVAVGYVSNVLGGVAPVQRIAEAAHEVGARVLLDASQAVPHMPVDVAATGADFLVATGHKMCGPTGVGFLWGRPEALEGMPPFMGGGEMIETVGLEASTYAPPPGRFEPGTPAIAEAIGLGAAVDYLAGLGMERVHAFERELGGLLHQELEALDGVTVYGPRPEAGRAALCSFSVAGVHASDITAVMDLNGVALRSGHQCCQPLHAALGQAATLRASLYVYNTPGEVETFIAELKDAIAFFS